MNKDKLQAAVELLLKLAPQGSKVVVFGSRAAGTSQPQSDLDIMVIEPVVLDRFQETHRLRLAVDQIFPDQVQPIDLVVTDQARFDFWSQAPNTLAFEARQHGRMYA